MICKYCGTLVSDEMKFCTNCGKKMERKTSYCTNCGNIINFNSKFCNICGAPTIIAEKMKKIRVSKVYSLIMLAITALVVAFVPSVTLSGSDIADNIFYSNANQVKVAVDHGAVGIMSKWPNFHAAKAILLPLLLVSLGILVISAGLHFINRWWPAMIPVVVFAGIVIFSDFLLYNSLRDQCKHFGFGFLLHIICIVLLAGSFSLNRYRTKMRQDAVSKGMRYKMQKPEIIAIIGVACFVVAATVFSIVKYTHKNTEYFLETPQAFYTDRMEAVKQCAKEVIQFKIPSEDDISEYRVMDYEGDGNGRYVVLMGKDGYSEYYYAVCIKAVDIYTGYYHYSDNVSSGYNPDYVMDEAKSKDWGEENYDAVDYEQELKKGDRVPYSWSSNYVG